MRTSRRETHCRSSSSTLRHFGCFRSTLSRMSIRALSAPRGIVPWSSFLLTMTCWIGCGSGGAGGASVPSNGDVIGTDSGMDKPPGTHVDAGDGGSDAHQQVGACSQATSLDG